MIIWIRKTQNMEKMFFVYHCWYSIEDKGDGSFSKVIKYLQKIASHPEKHILLPSCYKRWITSRYVTSTRDIPQPWPWIFAVSASLEKQFLSIFGKNPHMNSSMVISITMDISPVWMQNNLCKRNTQKTRFKSSLFSNKIIV